MNAKVLARYQLWDYDLGYRGRRSMRFFLVTFAIVLALRFLPGLLLRLVLAFPREHEMRSVCLVGSACATSPAAPSTRPARRLVRLKPLLVSSSVLAILALAAAALAEWHPAGLMLMLR